MNFCKCRLCGSFNRECRPTNPQGEGCCGSFDPWVKTKIYKPKPFIFVLIRIPGEAPLPIVREAYMDNDFVFHTRDGVYSKEEVTEWMLMPE